MKNHNMWFVFSLLSLVLIAPFGAINSWIAVLAIIISGAFFAVWYIKEMEKQEKEGEVKMSNVIHPGHYNIPGRKECIEEMLDKFGYGKTEAFCELNSYKYQYRHEQKNGQEDLDKASNYQKMLMEYIRKDPRFKVADHYGLEVQMQQLIEEMAELTQAIANISESMVRVNQYQRSCQAMTLNRILWKNWQMSNWCLTRWCSCLRVKMKCRK